ncbi:MAG: SRPBCC family protein [Bacteroidota bacterium]
MSLAKQQTNYHFHYSILVNASPQKVWDFLIDVNRWKDWDTELHTATLSGNFSVGTKGIIIPKKGPKLQFYISELTPNESYTFVTKMPVGSLRIQRTLKQRGSQIEFTDDIEFTGFFKKIFGYVLGRNFRAVLPEVMENLKRIVENE